MSVLNYKKIKSMIFAAGEGLRLRPITKFIPKPLIPFIYRPIINYQIDLIKSIGIKEIAINLFHKPNKIKNYLKNFNDISFIYSKENSLLGTIGGMKKLENYFEDSTIITINCDVIFNISLQDVLKFHKQKHSDLTMVVKVDKNSNYPSDVGIDLMHRIRQIHSQPKYDNIDLRQGTFTGLLIMESTLLKEYVPENTKFELASQLIPILLKENKRIFAYEIENNWGEIGNFNSYFQTTKEILEEKIKIPLPYKKINHLWIGKNVNISKKSKIIEPSIIGDFTIIDKNCVIGPFAVLGNSVTVEENSKIKNSIIWNLTKIERNNNISNKIISNNFIVNLI